MKTLFIEARSSIDILLSPDEVERLKPIKAELGTQVGLITTVQHWHKIPELKRQLENLGFSALTGKGSRTKHEAQILGCDVGAATGIADKVDFFLYIGSGRFHPIAVAVFTDKPVFKHEPKSKTLSRVNYKEVDLYKKHVRAGQTAFISSNSIGVLMSEKSGQNNRKLAILIKQKLKEKGKKVYILAFDTLDFSQLENFPFIDCFVNTACPRIIDDYSKFPKPVVNASDIIQFL